MITAPRVLGSTVDEQTRCVHYRGETDVVALRFKCCGDFYPCYKCHDAAVDHPIIRWGAADLHLRAVLCGVCRYELRIDEYLGIEHPGGDRPGTKRMSAGHPRTGHSLTEYPGAEYPGAEYPGAEACPACAAPFNPGCSLHRDIYFDLGDAPRPEGVFARSGPGTRASPEHRA
ncbi:MAG: CHY zinc finger protein [Leucobacter sp.]